MELTRVDFTRETFATLLRSESLRCVLVAVERGWLRSASDTIVYYFSDIDHRCSFNQDRTEVVVPSATILTEDELVPHLYREEDGYFRWEIVLWPFAEFAGRTVLEVSLRDSAWTNRVITGKLAFPHEPFQLFGPDMPESWREDEPHAPVSLPMLRIGEVAG